MILGIISIIIGLIIYFSSLLSGTNTVQQQTVQYLGYVCASIFIVGGFIMITIKHKKINTSENKPLQNADIKPSNEKHESSIIDAVIDDNWKCGECGCTNSMYMNSCKNCGKYFRDR